LSHIRSETTDRIDTTNLLDVFLPDFRTEIC